MKTFSIGAAIRHGWGIFKNNKKTLTGATFILLVAGALLDMLKGSFHRYELSAVIVYVAILVASAIIKIGYLKMALKFEDGEPTSIREVFMHSQLLVKYAIGGVLLGLLFGVGLMLLIIPGLYILVTYGFVPALIVDEYISVGDAFRKSKDIATGYRWQLLGFYLVILLLDVIGTIPFMLGLFITIPVSALAYVHLYRDLLTRSETLENRA